MSMIVSELLQDKAKQSLAGVLFTIGPDLPVVDAVSLMVERDISSVVILEQEKMLGIISLRELLHGLHELGDALLKAKCQDVMKPDPPVAKPDDTVDHLRCLMTELHITHVPVMDQGVLIGILSFQDIARSAIKDAAFENKLLKQYIKNWPA
ncbi:MAG: CBS domain-containing protein [Betaproteobacteria bacterium]|nr:CBS domain-containing protein [Betaproteobacteria bacterium]